MQFDGAVIKEQGITFAVVVVKKSTLDNHHNARQAITNFQPVFPGLPIVLMAQDHHGRPTYLGRSDIARFLSSISPNRIPWQRYTLH